MDKVKKIPSEMKLNERWRACGETLGTYAGVGTVLVGGLSLVLFRGAALRAATTTFGTGFGAGMAWQKCSTDFEKDAKDDEKK